MRPSPDPFAWSGPQGLSAAEVHVLAAEAQAPSLLARLGRALLRAAAAQARARLRAEAHRMTPETRRALGI